MITNVTTDSGVISLRRRFKFVNREEFRATALAVLSILLMKGARDDANLASPDADQEKAELRLRLLRSCDRRSCSLC